MAKGYSLGGLIKALGSAAFLDVGESTGQVAPAANYAMKGDSYTKVEADKRHQPKGKYADGDRFQVGSNNASVTPPGGTYSFAINDSGEIFLWDGSKSVFRVSVSGEITLGSVDYSRLKNVPLVQTTGNSTTSFMSQKSVTDEIYKKIDKSAISQSYGWSTVNVMSQKATSDLLIAAGELRDVIAQRAVNITYINGATRPRFVTITGDSKEVGTASVVVNGITIQGLSTGGDSVLPFYCSFFVPIGGSYRLSSTGAFNLVRWTELS